MRTKPNYELKAHVLQNGMYNDFKTARKALIHQEIDYNNFLSFLDYLGIENAKECNRLLNSNQQRLKRLKTRITKMLNDGQCKFITITFTNEVLESTSIETRRRYVARWLKQYSNEYVANIDFGKTTEREHYHALILCDHLEKTWEYGFIDIKTARTKNASNIRLARYIAKLTNHAIKNTTKNQRLIYSRKEN